MKVRRPVVVLDPKNLPVRFPVAATAILWLFLDRYQAPLWGQIAAGVVMLLWWLGSWAQLATQTRLDLFTRREPLPGPDAKPGHYAAAPPPAGLELTNEDRDYILAHGIQAWGQLRYGMPEPAPAPTIKLSPREDMPPAPAWQPPPPVDPEKMTPEQRANAAEARRLREAGAELVDGG